MERGCCPPSRGNETILFPLGGRRRRNSNTERVLPQPEMSPVFVVIADIVSQVGGVPIS